MGLDDPAVQLPDRTGGVPRLTSEVFVIPVEEKKHLVYAPLRRAAFLGNPAAVRFLAAFQAGKTDATAAEGAAFVDFLRRIEILDAPAEVRPIRSFEGAPQPTTVTLLLTTACNLRCTYCYASTGTVPPRWMPLETACRGIDFVRANAVRTGRPGFEVSYHGGGEPTLAWATLTESWEYARAAATRSGLELRSAVATNGLLSDEQIDWVVAHLTGACVSLDGLPVAHDRHRRTAAGEGSSELVRHTLKRFENRGYHYGIRLTVTADQVGVLPDSIDYVCGNFRPEAVQVEPVYLLGRWRDGASAETERFVAAFREAARRAAGSGLNISFSAARLDTLTNHFCGVSRDNFCLSADGNVTACYEVFDESHPWASRFFYGVPAGEGYEFDNTVLAGLRAQAVEQRPYCADCFAKWHCAGDCYHKRLALGGPEGTGGAGRCFITRELIKDEILARIAASDGMFWHQPPCPVHGGEGRCD